LITYPSGRQVQTTFDSGGRASAVSQMVNNSPVKNYASGISYAPHGGIRSLTLANGLVETSTYNNRLQPTCLTAGSLLTVGLAYSNSEGTCGTAAASDNNGNVRQQAITRGAKGWTQTFGYDDVNRLSSASETSGWTQGYGYDRWGNRAVTSGYVPYPSLTPASVSEFSGNRWLGSGLSAATYDNAGNQVSAAAGTRTFVFDAENRMVSGTEPTVGAVSYTYDAELSSNAELQPSPGVEKRFVRGFAGRQKSDTCLVYQLYVFQVYDGTRRSRAQWADSCPFQAAWTIQLRPSLSVPSSLP